MKTRRTLLFVIVLLAAVLDAGSVPGQVDQRAIAQRLRSDDAAERRRALEAARALGPENTGPELRAALITALEREAKIHQQRYEAGRRGEPLEPLEDAEFITAVARVIVELRDPQAIPALTGALGTGVMVPRALAAFGELAASAVLRVVTSPEGWYDTISGGLIALRFMVEGRDTRPLSADTVEQDPTRGEAAANREAGLHNPVAGHRSRCGST